MYLEQKSELSNFNQNNSEEYSLTKKIIPWEKLGRVGVIKNWSEEVKYALIADYDSNDWQLVGDAITIVHDNVDDCQEILQ
jgi:hypothetical protein